MIQTLPERARTWVHANFPERQIYIRSDGRVQFFTFSATLQATMAGLTLLFLGWVAFASVNVIFKDHIIVAKDHRYRQMQANYESRIADLQLSYDELNGNLVATQDKFRSAADQLQRKQEAIAGLLGRRELLGNLLVNSAHSQMNDIPRAAGAATGNDGGANLDGQGVAAFGSLDGSSELSIMPQPVPPQPRTASPTRASFLTGTLRNLAGAAGALLHRSQPGPKRYASLNTPAFRELNAEINRVEYLDRTETGLLQGVDGQVTTRIADVEGVFRRVGLSPGKIEQQSGVGGPLIPASDVRIVGVDDQAFTNMFVGTSAHEQELGALFDALNHVPLTTPVHGSGFELSSDFGARIDPFTHQASFHPGLDFAGPWGAVVSATAPGRVVFAGPRAGYGNMVEIDHGYGIHTRYGHLSSILARVGARVAKGAPVGRLGSTGRSTGPHVHYEIRLADAVRDPSKFIEAGRHVQ
jgi:murein DD-endopeptidase MepM/ murein hydrolase activator NlpD